MVTSDDPSPVASDDVRVQVRSSPDGPGPEVLGAPTLCIKGCGFAVAPGVDKRGNPLKTCCRSCALGQGHDSNCSSRRSAESDRAQDPRAGRSASRGGGAEELCGKGCGRRTATGRDQLGRPYKTCCRGCARDGVHDISCQVTDPEERRQKLNELYASDSPGRRWRRYRRRVLETILYVWDPVWGQAELQEIEGEQAVDPLTAAAQALTLTSFIAAPCCVVGCCWRAPQVGVSFGISKEEPRVKRIAWCKTICSISTLLTLAQVVLFLLMRLDYPSSSSDEIDSSTFILFGAKVSAKITHQHEWWRLAASCMLHGNVIHLISNVTMQIRFGFFLEYMWGQLAWVIIYVFSGTYGMALSCFLMPDAITVGSSGAISGLFGAWIPAIAFTWNRTQPKEIQMRNGQMVLAVTSAVSMVVVSFMPMVDFAAHTGGFVMGLLLYMALGAGNLETLRWRLVVRAVGILGACALWGVTIWLMLSAAETAEPSPTMTSNDDAS